MHLFIAALIFAASGEGWTRHAIDDTSRGADGVRLADVNGDGLRDIVTGWEEGGVVRVYTHPGASRVREQWPAVQAGIASSVEDAIFVDLDGDGATDVVSSCEGGTRVMQVHWSPRPIADYLNAALWQTEPIPASAGRQWMWCLPMTISGRGSPDLVAGSKNENAQFGWFERPKDHERRLEAWKWHGVMDVGWIMSIIPADMNADGIEDIVVTNRRQPNRGCWWFEMPNWQRHFVGGDDVEIMFAAVADLSGAGKLEIVAATLSHELLWFSSEKDGAWTRRSIAIPQEAGVGKGVAVGDIDKDGKNDIVFSCEHAEGKQGVMWLPAAHGFKKARSISGTAGTKFDLVVLEDLDLDGDLDVITCEERELLGVIWYENTEAVIASGESNSEPGNR